MRGFRFAAAMLITPLILAPFTSAHAQIGVSVGIGVAITVAPPMLPVYEQPPMPALGDIWTPGYWAYDDDDYYWVQGTWVEPPSEGMLWTPGYWGWQNGSYLFHVGYWGPSVGYYGGIDYGYGYGGSGYDGGEWRDHHFAYNRAANNFGGFHDNNAYDRPISGDRGERASFHGPHGITEGPTAQQEQADRQGHMQPTAQQARHVQAAAQDRTLRSSVNGGHPAEAATPQPRQMNAPAPMHETAPMHEAAPQRPAQPQHEAAPQRQAPPPQQHEAAPAHDAPRDGEHH